MALRRNIFHLALYSLSTIVTQGLTYFVLIPIGTRILTPDEYGAVEALQAYSAILVIFFSFYISSAYTRYYYEHRDDHRQLAKLTTTSLLFLLLLGLLLAAPAYWVGRYYLTTLSVQPGRYLLILAVLLPLTNLLLALASIGTAYLNQTRRNVAINIVSIAAAVTSTIVALLCFLYWGVREETFFIATLIIQGISATYGIYALFREGLIVTHVDWRLLRPCLTFAIGSLPFSVCSYVWNLSDRIVLGYYAGVDLLGRYALAYKVAMLLQLGYNQFWKVTNPYLLSWLADHREEDERDLLKLITLYSLILGLGGLFLVYFGPFILTLMAPAKYQLDPTVLAVCVVAIVLLGIRKYTDCHLWYRKRLMTMFLLQGILPASLNLGANLVFIPIFREYAAAWSTLLAAVVVLGLSIFVNSRLERIPHIPQATWAAAIAFGVGLAAYAMVRLSCGGMGVVAESGVLAGVYVVVGAALLLRIKGMGVFHHGISLGGAANSQSATRARGRNE